MELEPWVLRCNEFSRSRGQGTLGEEIDVFGWNADAEDGKVVVQGGDKVNLKICQCEGEGAVRLKGDVEKGNRFVVERGKMTYIVAFSVLPLANLHVLDISIPLARWWSVILPLLGVPTVSESRCCIRGSGFRSICFSS